MVKKWAIIAASLLFSIVFVLFGIIFAPFFYDFKSGANEAGIFSIDKDIFSE